MLIDQTQGISESGPKWIVLPWLGISSTLTWHVTNPSPNYLTTFPRDDAWYAGASLVVVEWTAAGSYRTSAQATLPAP
jgi:hypothetical protein